MLPGTSLSFQISRFAGKPQTISTTIPSDYQPGRPLRLKGLGRKLGPFAGDLYLRLLPK
jgi:molecular chaperone DnaJ